MPILRNPLALLPFLLLTFSTFAADNHASSRIKPRVGSLNTFIDKVIPLVVLGDGWTERIVLQNVDDTWSSAGQITFFSADGAPLNVNLRGMGASSIFNFNIDQGHTVVFETVPTNTPQQLGWALVEQHSTSTATNNFSGIGDTFGQIIFRKSTPGLPDFMCSMPLGGQAFTKVSTFFDNTNSNFTGMGIVTADDTTGAVNLRVTIRDISGAVISQKIISRPQRTLYWMNLAVDFPDTSNRMGTFEVEVVNAYSTILTGVSLQFSGNAFTVITPFEAL